MAARRVFGRLPMVCGATTLAGMALGVAYDGVADIAAAVVMLTPIIILALTARFVRQSELGAMSRTESEH